MVMRAVNGRLENGRFTPYDLVELPTSTEAILVVQEKVPVLKRSGKRTLSKSDKVLSGKNEAEDRDKRVAWLKMIDALILNSLDEDFPDIKRSTEMNKPLKLAD